MMPPLVAAANDSTSTPNRSSRLRTPTVAPEMAKTKVPSRSRAISRVSKRHARVWKAPQDASAARARQLPGRDRCRDARLHHRQLVVGQGAVVLVAQPHLALQVGDDVAPEVDHGELLGHVDPA